MSEVFFTDRDLGLTFPSILLDAGLPVERHADHFRPDTKDEDWLADVATRGWIVVTHDGRIRYKPNELAAVIRHRVTLLVVVGKAPHRELARSFVNTVNQIRTFIAAHPPPVIAKVYRANSTELERNARTPGRVELWYPPTAPKRRR